MIKLNHLRDFIAIARHQSVRGAAKALRLSQPALTKSLKELEKELDITLFERQTRGMSLTRAGQLFLARAEGAVGELRRGYEELNQFKGDMSGSVCVALSSSAVLELLPFAIKGFHKAHPEIQVKIVEGMFPVLENRLKNGGIDFYIGPRPAYIAPQQFNVDTVFVTERLVMGRTGHPRRGARSLAELVDEDWVLTGLRENAAEEFDEQFSAVGLPSPRVSVIAESMLALLSIIATTDTLGIIPKPWTQTTLFGNCIKAFQLRERLFPADIVEITRTALPLTPAAEKLRAYFRRAAGTPFVRSSDGTVR